ncbi:helix-turn-helix domain-containing protein [Streptomyces sp. NPDC005876]|uniref:helix-turn-helix domain-containing protein n=2 Tax=unclassified Streptomyces TaxID=2593676 RepID=UPI003404F6B5
MASALPHPRLRPGVTCYRGFRLSLRRPRKRLEVPAGMTVLLIVFEEKLRLTRTADLSDPVEANASTPLLCGPHTSARTGEHDGRLSGVEVAFAPWAAFTLFGTALQPLANEAVGLHELLSTRADDLTDALASAVGWRDRFALLDTVLWEWARRGPEHSARVAWAWQELARKAGAVPIPALARRAGWSQRQMEKRFREQIGLTPKTTARVFRLQRALQLLVSGLSSAEVAVLAGYHDQAHFGHECKAMTGHAPCRFLARRAAGGQDPSFTDRFEGQATGVLLPATARAEGAA